MTTEPSEAAVWSLAVWTASDHTGRRIKDSEVLLYAAAVKAVSEHPLGHAIATAGLAAEPVSETPLEAMGRIVHSGGGVEGLVRRAHSGLTPGGGLNTRRVLVGQPAWLTQQGVTISDAVRLQVEQREAAGAAAVAVAWNGMAVGVISQPLTPAHSC